MKFADLTSGKRFSLGPVMVDAAEVVAFAGKYDA
jgi:hypothetical protein